jgi:L-cysteine desulfidase
MGMTLERYLSAEWVPALGCTEPASIAYAVMTAAARLDETPEEVLLKTDPRIYKNCYAVGIPNSGHKTGIQWAAAIGAFLKDINAGLQCFEFITPAAIKAAGRMIRNGAVTVLVDKSRKDLFIDATVVGKRNRARCVIENTHTNVTLVSKNDKTLFRQPGKKNSSIQAEVRCWAAGLSPKRMIGLATSLSKGQRERILSGAALNLEIATHGSTLLPKAFFGIEKEDLTAKAAGLVGAGVYARMWGEPFPVMSVAGSGNKGIVLSVPLIILQKEWRIPRRKIEEALFIAMLVTSKTTYELGTLSAVCGCSNAAGVGLACAIVYLKGGSEKEMSLAINNMVGNITGMICDGAKIGCAMKTMTSVDAAFRSATLALNGIGIPSQDGIVGRNGTESLRNMGSIATRGMEKADDEILNIMERKLRGGSQI